MTAPNPTTVSIPDRLQGIIPPEAATANIGLVGVGASSVMALMLARHGVAQLRLSDPDTVETENLCRTAYLPEQLGQNKAVACADLIRQATGRDNAARAFGCDLTADPEARDRFLADLDILIAATDRLEAQLAVNEWAIDHRIGAVFVGMHAFGRGGMVHWYRPGAGMACYNCMTGHRQREMAQADLAAAPGSLIDIVHVDTIAAKVVLGMLDRRATSEYGRFFASLPGNEIIVRTHPDYRWQDGVDPFAVLLSDLPEQPKPYARELAWHLAGHNTMFLSHEADLLCLVCEGGP